MRRDPSPRTHKRLPMLADKSRLRLRSLAGGCTMGHGLKHARGIKTESHVFPHARGEYESHDGKTEGKICHVQMSALSD